MIRTLDDMMSNLANMPIRRLVVAHAVDAHTIGAVSLAVEKGLVEGILVGNKDEIRKVCEQEGISISSFQVIHETNPVASAQRAVAMIRAGEGDLIMKGTVSTDQYMRAILNKEKGIMTPGSLLTHVAVLEPVSYHKLLIIGDVAIIPKPDLKEKKIIMEHLIQCANILGIGTPKVAVIAATELVLPGMEACTDAAALSKMAERGQITNAIVDGPLALDVALDKESAMIKKIRSQVAGEADCLLFPNIESGNVFYKCHTKLMSGTTAAIVAGARVPVILSSRGDTTKNKLYSIALGTLLSMQN